ncbi:hypothetical protein ACA910_018736 [Epithemia clementina (nom. ined.)]
MDDDMLSPQIPVLQRPLSLMEHGPNSQNLATAAQARHPVDQMQRMQAARGGGGTTGSVDLELVRHVYGSGLAMRLATEQQMATQHEQALPLRHPTLSSSSSSLYREIVTGQDMRLDFGDFLSRPEHEPDYNTRENLHVVAERKLGMW